MSDAAAVIPIEYAAPGIESATHDRAVIRTCCIAALVLGLHQTCLLGFSIYAMIDSGLRRTALANWPLAAAEIVGLLTLAGACIGLARPDRARRSMPCLFAGLFALQLASTAVVSIRRYDNTVRFAPYGIDWTGEATRIGLEIAAYAFLLLPALLLTVGLGESWRRRLVTTAAVAALACGWAGIVTLQWAGEDNRRQMGGSLLDGIRVALLDPYPIIGLWPLLGCFASLLLFVALIFSRAFVLWLAALCLITFAATLTATRFSWWDGTSSLVWWMRTLSALSSAREFVGACVPAALIIWALCRARERFLAS